MSGWNREVNVTSVEGVPLVWAEAPGPLRASLMFRVGHADERLPWSGITHLVEHLALFELGPQQAYEFNGAVTSNRTMFVATGSPADVVAFLSHVTTALGNLPLDRAETEKSVLLTEATSRSTSAGDVMFSLRFGARGNGLYRYKEFGLTHVPAPWITAWSARYFNRENAVLWLSGPPPAGLHLPLPAGQKMPDPDIAPMTLGLPAYAQAPVGGAGVSMLGRRSTPLAMAAAIAAARLLKRLRYDKGIAYSVQGGYFPMDHEHAHVSLWTDAQAGHAAAVLNDTVHSMYGMSTEGPTAEELADEVGTLARNLEREDAPVAWLDRTAVRILNGEPPQHPSELLADMQTVTPAAARDVMAAAIRTAIYLGPLDVPAPPGLHAYARPAPEPVRGNVLPHARSDLWKHPPTLSVADDGLTLNVNADERVTVMYRGCEALLRYGDGGVCLVGFEGSFLPVNPGEWVQAPLAVQQILQAIPAELVVPNAGTTTPAMINVPAQAQSRRLSVGGIPLDRWIALLVFVAVGVALLMFAVFGNSTGVGSGPPLISLVIWGVLAYRVYRWLRI